MTPIIFTGRELCYTGLNLQASAASAKTRPATRPVVKPAPGRAPAAARPKSYARSDSTEFRTYAEDLMRHGKRLILIGVGLNILQRDPFAMEIMGRAAAGQCQLEVYLADPTSPAIESRLIEEELGAMKPPVGRAGVVCGSGGLCPRIWFSSHPVRCPVLFQRR